MINFRCVSTSALGIPAQLFPWWLEPKVGPPPHVPLQVRSVPCRAMLSPFAFVVTLVNESQRHRQAGSVEDVVTRRGYSNVSSSYTLGDETRIPYGG